MNQLSWIVHSAPLPVIVHDRFVVKEANENFKRLCDIRDPLDANLEQWLKQRFTASEFVDKLIEGIAHGKEVQVNLTGQNKGIKFIWKVYSFPLADSGQGVGGQITWFVDESLSTIQNAYWDLNVRTSLITTQLLRKDAQLKASNLELEKTNEQLKLDVAKRIAAEQEIKDAAFQLRTVIDSVGDGIAFSDEQGRFLIFNSQMQEITGYTMEEANKSGDFLSLIHRDPEERLRALKRLSEFKENDKPKEAEAVIQAKGGMQKILLVSTAKLRYKEQQMFLSVFRDITERKRAEEKIIHLNRLYSVLSNTNQAIVRIRSRQKLFEEVCRVAVEYGLFKMCWIGAIADHAKFLMMPVSCWGYNNGFLDELMAAGRKGIQDPAVTALLKEGKNYFICNNLENDRHLFFWSENALKRGYYSFASFLLKTAYGVEGILTIYGEKPNLFSEAEIQLLQELSVDIAFALEYLEQERQRKQAENQLNESMQRLENIAEGITDSVYLLSKNFEIIWANHAALKQVGHTFEEVCGKTCYAITHKRQTPCEPPNDICPILEVLKTGKPITADHVHFDGSGNEVDVEVSVYPVKDEKGEIVQFVHVARDITEHKRIEDELKANLEDLKQFKKATIDREIKMIELKKEINKFSQELGRKPPYEES